jgi:hypothetical protein
MCRNFLAMLLILSGVTLRAGDTALERETLKGVKAVNVVVDPLDPQLEGQGLTSEMVRDRLKERLQQASIPIDPQAVEFLGLHITSMQTGKQPYSLCFSIGFYQPVLLVRDQKIRTASPTWGVNAVLVAPAKPMAQSALHTADQLADIFVNAYQAANPK